LGALEYRMAGKRDPCVKLWIPKGGFLPESANEIFVKNGRYIREIEADHPEALLFLGRYCSNLTKLVCRFSIPENDRRAKKREALACTWELVAKSPHLHTLRLGDPLDGQANLPWPYSPTNVALRQLQNLSNLQHLTLSLMDTDYLEFCARFPRLVEAQLQLKSVQSFFRPFQPYHSKKATTSASGSVSSDNLPQKARQEIETSQSSLRQLFLLVDCTLLASMMDFDPQVLKCIFRQFPRLGRLKIQDRSSASIFVDLNADSTDWLSYNDIYPEKLKDARGGSLLVLSSSGWRNDVVAEIITLLPIPLKRFHWDYLDQQTLEVLVTHCSETLEDVDGGGWHPRFPSVVLMSDCLLARCPKLKLVHIRRLGIRFHDLIAHPWVCCDTLEHLTCAIDGFPKLSNEEQEMITKILERERGQEPGRGCTTPYEQLAWQKQEYGRRFRQALQDQLEKCPNLKHTDFEDLEL
ncbi:hypothetical protein BGZ73_003715, partial [Actinomortierella ambigua]